MVHVVPLSSVYQADAIAELPVPVSSMVASRVTGKLGGVGYGTTERSEAIGPCVSTVFVRYMSFITPLIPATSTRLYTTWTDPFLSAAILGTSTVVPVTGSP